MELNQAEDFLRFIPENSEAGSVMVGVADFVDHPISAFVRLSEGRNMGIKVSRSNMQGLLGTKVHAGPACSR